MFKGLKDKLEKNKASPASQAQRTPAAKVVVSGIQSTPKSERSSLSELKSERAEDGNVTSDKDSLLKVQQSFTPSVNNKNGQTSDTESCASESESVPAMNQSSGFFRRLEFLTPLKDQVAAKLSESKDSINSMMDELKSPIGPKPTSAPTRVANNSNSSASGESGSDPTVVDIPKDQLLGKVFRLEKTLQKYRLHYSELKNRYQEMLKDHESMKIEFQKSEEKNKRRLNDVTETIDLEKQAKMHLEEELNALIDEKQEHIGVLQTQIHLLKIKEKEQQGDGVDEKIARQLEEIEDIKSKHAAERIELEEELSQAKQAVKQAEDDRMIAIAEAKHQTHKTIEAKDNEVVDLREMVESLRKQMEDSKNEHEQERASLRTELESAASRMKDVEAEGERVRAERDEAERRMRERVEQVEKSLDDERKTLVADVSRGKAEVLRLVQRQSQEKLELASREKSDALKSARQEFNQQVQQINQQHSQEMDELRGEHARKRKAACEESSAKLKALEAEMEGKMERALKEKEEEMRLAIEERELNKMATIEKHDDEMQGVLLQRERELADVTGKLDEMKRVVGEDREQWLLEKKDLVAQIKQSKLSHASELDEVKGKWKKESDEQQQRNAQETERLDAQHQDALQRAETKWEEKLLKAKKSHEKTLEKMRRSQENDSCEKTSLFQQQSTKIDHLESQLGKTTSDRDALQAKLEEKAGELVAVGEKLNKCESELEKSRKNVDKLKTFSEKHMKSSKQKMDEANEKIKVIEAQRDAKAREIFTIQRENGGRIAAFEKDLLDINQKLEEKTKGSVLLEKKMEIMEVERKRDLEKLKINVGTMKKLEKTLQELEKRNEGLGAKMVEASEMAARGEQKAKELTEARARVAELMEKMEEGEKVSERRREDVERQKKELDELKVKLQQGEKRVEELEKVESEGEAERGRLEARVEKLSKSHQDYIKQMELTMNEKSKQLSNKEKAIAKMKKDKEEQLKRLRESHVTEMEKTKAQHAKEREEVEKERKEETEKAKQQHAVECGEVEEKWTNKYAELKKKAEQRIAQLQKNAKEARKRESGHQEAMERSEKDQAERMREALEEAERCEERRREAEARCEGVEADMKEMGDKFAEEKLQLQQSVDELSASLRKTDADLREAKCEKEKLEALAQVHKEQADQAKNQLNITQDKLRTLEDSSEKKIEEILSSSSSESKSKMDEMRVNSEKRLEQIRKTFGAQLEEKLRTIEELSSEAARKHEEVQKVEQEKEKVLNQLTTKLSEVERCRDELEARLKEEGEGKKLADAQLARQILKHDEQQSKLDAAEASCQDLRREVESLRSEGEEAKRKTATSLEDRERECGEMKEEVSKMKRKVEKLERSRDQARREVEQERSLHEQHVKQLTDERESCRKQMEVLSQQSSNADESEEKMEKLREDYERRLGEKQTEYEERVKTLVKEYEKAKNESEERHDKEVDVAREKYSNFEQMMRRQHHDELVSLQLEIANFEKKIEQQAERHEKEMETREMEMSEQVDKAVYRALTAEKKLQDTGLENLIKELKHQVNELSKELSQSHGRERQLANNCDDIRSQLSLRSHLADPEKVKYLRQVLFQYMMGAEGKTMAKVLVVLMDFDKTQTKLILEKHQVSKTN